MMNNDPSMVTVIFIDEDVSGRTILERVGLGEIKRNYISCNYPMAMIIADSSEGMTAEGVIRANGYEGPSPRILTKEESEFILDIINH